MSDLLKGIGCLAFAGILIYIFFTILLPIKLQENRTGIKAELIEDYREVITDKMTFVKKGSGNHAGYCFLEIKTAQGIALDEVICP